MYTASVITVSDRAAGGTYEDQSGPAVVQLLKEHGYEVIDTIIIPDEKNKEAPGIAEYMRQKSMEITPRGMLSRGVAGIRNRSLIINLPGSPKGAVENLSFVLPHLAHGLDMLGGVKE